MGLVTQVKLIAGLAQMQFVWPILFRVKNYSAALAQPNRRRHNIQHNDTQHDSTQHNGNKRESLDSDTQLKRHSAKRQNVAC